MTKPPLETDTEAGKEGWDVLGLTRDTVTP